MSNETKVLVVRFGDRKFLQCQWTDPQSGRKKTKSTGTTKRREAERFAAKLEKDITDGKHGTTSKIGWDEFWDRYADESLSGLANGTLSKSLTVKGLCEKFRRLDRIAQLDSVFLSQFASSLRNGSKSEDTIKGYLAYIAMALKWASKMKMISQMPEFPKVKRIK